MKDKYKYTTYLIGSMEKTAEKDDGSSKREVFEKEFLFRDVYPINPVKLESSKTGMTTDEVKEKMKGWVAGGSWDLFRKHAISIWKGVDKEENGQLIHIPGDIDYVLMSDFLTFSYNKGDMPCGSFGEAFIALEHNIPVYLITDINKGDLPKSLLQCIEASEGEVFNTINKFFEFVDEKYKLKRKESNLEEKKEEKQ
jgi:hypothetical protein